MSKVVPQIDRKLADKRSVSNIPLDLFFERKYLYLFDTGRKSLRYSFGKNREIPTERVNAMVPCNTVWLVYCLLTSRRLSLYRTPIHYWSSCINSYYERTLTSILRNDSIFLIQPFPSLYVCIEFKYRFTGKKILIILRGEQCLDIVNFSG